MLAQLSSTFGQPTCVSPTGRLALSDETCESLFCTLVLAAILSTTQHNWQYLRPNSWSMCCDGRNAIPCNGKHTCPAQRDYPDLTGAPTAGLGYNEVIFTTDSKPNKQGYIVGRGDQGHCTQEYDMKLGAGVEDDNEQCQEGFHCCLFMEKCVNGGSMTCWTPITFCQPLCMDTESVHKCRCHSKGSRDTYPESWQSPTCSAGETSIIVITTPKPVSPSLLLTYQNFQSKAQWQLFRALVRFEIGAWKMKRDCSYLKFTQSLFNYDQYWFFTGHSYPEFGDIVGLSDNTFVFKQIVSKIEHVTPIDPWVETMCRGTQQKFSILPESNLTLPTGRLLDAVLLVSFSLIASTAGLAVLQHSLRSAGPLLST